MISETIGSRAPSSLFKYISVHVSLPCSPRSPVVENRSLRRTPEGFLNRNGMEMMSDIARVQL